MQEFVDVFKEKAKEYDVISFDIFDTLITRTVPDPLMVFDMVEIRARSVGITLEDFRKLRWDAQLERGIANENLYEVYEQLQIMTQITDSQREFLMQQEIECEKEVLIRRETVCNCFKWAIYEGKRVFIVSDMYIPRSILETILCGLGISGYEDLLVSCDYRKLKSEGLYHELLAKVDSNSRILHIGDNEYGDGECADKCGLDTFHIDSGIAEYKRLLKSEEAPSKWHYSDEMAYLGKRIAYEFNSPHIKDSKRNDLKYIMGKFFLGPFLLRLTMWITEMAKEAKCDEILFSSRDGYLPYQIFTRLSKIKDLGIGGKYFYISRKAAVACNSDQEAVINTLVNSSKGLLTGEEILKEKFCLSKQDIKKYDEEKHNNIAKYIWSHYEAIHRNAKKLKQNYFKYMGNIGLEIGKKYAIYDFVSGGTCQKSLDMFAPFDIEGLYVWYRDTDNVSAKSFIDFQAEWFMEYYKVFEQILSSFEPSLRGFNDDGMPFFQKETRSENEMKIVQSIQDGIMDYIDEALNEGDDIVMDSPNQMCVNILGLCRTLNVDELGKLSIFDDWNNK